MDKIRQLQDMINESNRIVFFGGAGVSTESNIPDFRSADGLYKQKYRYSPEQIVSHSFFMQHTEEFYDFYKEKMMFLDAKPNKAHLKLAELEAAGRRPCIRLRCPSQNYAFEDAVFGPFSMTLEACGGDFALRRSDGVIAYQLAVVVDDGLMGITQVVRGEDLLVSTPRQLALFDLLGYPRPAYMHLPLLCDPEGERLAKRHASLTLASLRDAGVSPAAVAGYLGWKAGLIGALAPAHPRNLLPAFDPGRLRFLPERVLIEADLTASLSVVC